MDTSIFKSIRSRQKTQQPVPAAVWRNPLYFVGFGLGSGAMPFAPGTFGTLMAIPFYLLLSKLSLPWYLLFVCAFSVFSAWVCERLSRELKIHDHPGMCIDEFVGFFVTMIYAPAGVGWVITGFLLFRLFDIWKPWPIIWLDKHIHGGIGMVLDDIVAGLFSMFFIQIIAMFLI
jgi:phosphatidylglycerophosphatase A